MKGKRLKRIQCMLLALLLLAPLLSAEAEDSNVITITVSAVGDCTLGRNHLMGYENSWNHKFAEYGADYFLKNVAKIFKNDDITIANLEGVLSKSAQRQRLFYRQKKNKLEIKEFCHLGKPKYLKALTGSGVDVVSFANNHNIDYGIQGFEDTVDACSRYGLPVAYYDTLVRQKVNGLTVGVISIDATYCNLSTAEKYLKTGMGDLRRDCDLIIACMHWGQNYRTKPNKEQRYLGHLCVDLGADLVIGSHAHILQGVERYKGRYIFYSLANFTYGGRTVPYDADTLIVRQTFTFVDGRLQVDDNVEIIPCWMSTQTSINDFCPVVKKNSTGRAIIEKVNKLSKPFSVRFDSSGHPVMEAEKYTDLPLLTDASEALTPDKIPKIIYTLLDLSKGSKKQK